MKRFGVLLWIALVISGAQDYVHAGGDGVPVSIVNYSTLPVHATAIALDEKDLCARLGLPDGTPLRVVGADKEAMPVVRGSDDGKKVIRLHVALAPTSRMDVVVQRAERWEDAAVAKASSDAASATGTIGNGVLSVEFGKKGWNLRFQNAVLDQGLLVRDGGLDFWVDNQNRGRIMNSDPHDLNLARYANSKLEHCETTLTPEGRPVFRTVRRMDGLARAMTVTETFELVPGQPILVYRIQWRNEGDAPLWIAYVDSGNGVYGKWARDGLLPGPLIQRKKSPIQGDINGGETRPSWLPRFCCTSMESPATGCGFGMSTLLATPKNVGVGSMIWGNGASGFQVNFIDPVQGQFPFLVRPGGTLENGFAFLATQNAVSTYRQTVELWTAVQTGKMPKLAPPCAVFVDGQPLQAQSVLGLVGDTALNLLQGRGAVRQAALRMDFNKYYDLRVSVKTAAPGDALELLARPLAGGAPIQLLRATRSAEHVVALNQHFKADEVAFVLEAKASGSAELTGLSIVETLPVAPTPLSPVPNAAFTDIATMFRWVPLPMVVDYDIQWSRSPAFDSPESVRVTQSQETPWYLPPDDRLPAPGKWHWRIRGVKGTVLGQWSTPRCFAVNNDHSTKPVKRPVTAQSPLFTLEASKVIDYRNFTPEIPADLAPYVGIIVEGFVAKHLTIQEAMCGVEKLPHPFLIRSHPPTWLSLADLEWVCQNMPNFIGMQGGETLSTLYDQPRDKDSGDAAYHRRMTRICAKYGAFYQEADGTYKDDKWQDLMDKQGAFLREFGPWLVLTQKNNIIRRQFYSQSAAMGLWLGGITHQHGAWEDGGFYWQNAGFNRLGTCEGERRGILKTMPRNFWSLVFVMGISRGCALYSLDGQTLMENPKEIARFPHARFPAAIWTTDGKTSDTFKQFVLPLIRGVVEHQLIPTRDQVRDNVKLAVYNDRKTPGDVKAWPHYVEYGPLYAATYGFRKMGNIDGQLWEFFPNTGRYFYIPVLVQGDEPIPGVKNIPLSQLQEIAKVKEMFDAAYPHRDQGEALVCRIGSTFTVQNTHENQDVTESFRVALGGGAFRSLSGKVAPHSYVVGKIEDQGRRLWMLANTEYPDRNTEMSIACPTRPQVQVTPPSAAKESRWDEQAQRLVLRLSHQQGAIEVTVK